MKHFFLIAFLSLFHVSVIAQTANKNNLCYDWVLKSGWFGDEQIAFEKLDTTKGIDLAQIIKFNQAETLSEYIYNPKHYGMCGNGMLYFETATWKLDSNEISFDVKGGHFADDKFHYKIIYSIETISATKLILKKKKVILADKKQF